MPGKRERVESKGILRNLSGDGHSHWTVQASCLSIYNIELRTTSVAPLRAWNSAAIVARRSVLELLCRCSSESGSRHTLKTISAEYHQIGSL